MIRLNYAILKSAPRAFKAFTGLSRARFDALFAEIEPRYRAVEQARRHRPNRRRAAGAGHPHKLSLRDRFLLFLVDRWLGVPHYTSAWFFNVALSTVRRTRKALLPVLESITLPAQRRRSSNAERREIVKAFERDLPALTQSVAFAMTIYYPFEEEWLPYDETDAIALEA